MTDAEAETPMFAHMMGRVDSLEKTLILGKIQAKREEVCRGRWLDNIIESMEMNLRKLWDNSEGQGSLACFSQRGRRVTS